MLVARDLWTDAEHGRANDVGPKKVCDEAEQVWVTQQVQQLAPPAPNADGAIHGTGHGSAQLLAFCVDQGQALVEWCVSEGLRLRHVPGGDLRIAHLIHHGTNKLL